MDTWSPRPASLSQLVDEVVSKTTVKTMWVRFLHDALSLIVVTGAKIVLETIVRKGVKVQLFHQTLSPYVVIGSQNRLKICCPKGRRGPSPLGDT